MKKRIVSLIVILIAVLAASTGLAQDEEDKGKAQPPGRVRPRAGRGEGRIRPTDRMRPGGRIRDEQGRRQIARGMMLQERLKKLQEQMKKRQKKNDDFVGELEAIKEQAEKEEAKKTVKLLDNLINKKVKEFTNAIKKLESNVKRIKEQIKKQAEEARKREKSGEKPQVRGQRPGPGRRERPRPPQPMPEPLKPKESEKN